MLHIHIYKLPFSPAPPLQPMKAAGSATAATAEAAIRTHCLSQAPFGQQQDTAVIMAHEAIGLGATLPQCGQRRVQCATIATLAAQPNPRRGLLLLLLQLAPNDTDEQQAE